MKTILLAFLVVFVGSVHASNWVSIWKREYLEYFIDMDNIKRDGVFVEAWTKTNTHLNNMGETTTSVDFWRVDCSNYTSKFYTVTIKDNIEISTFSSGANILISDTGIAFQIFKRFCK